MKYGPTDLPRLMKRATLGISLYIKTADRLIQLLHLLQYIITTNITI